jgi:hypothetical protein
MGSPYQRIKSELEATGKGTSKGGRKYSKKEMERSRNAPPAVPGKPSVAPGYEPKAIDIGSAEVDGGSLSNAEHEKLERMGKKIGKRVIKGTR